MLCRLSIEIMRNAADDALDAFSLFAVAGMVGSVLTAFGSAAMLGGMQAPATLRTQVVVQLFSCAGIATWSLVMTLLVAKVTKIFMGDLRVSPEVEDFGTDLMLEEGMAYANE